MHPNSLKQSCARKSKASALNPHYLYLVPILCTFVTAAPTENIGRDFEDNMRAKGLIRWTLEEELARNSRRGLQARGDSRFEESDSDDDDDDERNEHEEEEEEAKNGTSDEQTRNGLEGNVGQNTPAEADQIQDAVQETITASRSGKSESEELRTHLAIGFGTVAAVLVVAAIAFLLYRFRYRLFSRYKHQSPYNYPPMSENGGHLRGGARSLFGDGTTTVTGTRLSHTFPAHPAPALAPSTVGLARAASRRHLVRDSLLQQSRFPIAVAPHAPVNDDSDARTFFLDEQHSPAPTYTTQPAPLQMPQHASVSIADGFTHFAPPPVPDSPEMAKQSRFSWTTANTAKTPGLPGGGVRQSMESEPPRFRTVNSWVSNQANHVERGSRVSQGKVGSVPTTPRAFRAHPGAEVQFLARHNRLESRDLDRIVQRGE